MSKRQSKGRTLNGLLLLDKSSGESSNRALQKVKRIYNAAKAGHTGTLDPLATGLLVICFGRATKISEFLLSADKRYEVTFKLGVKTTSGDTDGQIIAYQDASSITEEQIKSAASTLTGQIEQVPPMVSALKHQGKRLYNLARQGVEVEREPRKVIIYLFEFINKQQGVVNMHVHCSKGTYIRTLVEDLGKILACGAHVTKLRRTALGPFIDFEMHTLHELEQLAEKEDVALDKLVLSTDVALQEFPAIAIDSTTMSDIQHGRTVQLPNFPKNGRARIYDENMKFYGVASVSETGKLTVKCLS